MQPFLPAISQPAGGDPTSQSCEPPPTGESTSTAPNPNALLAAGSLAVFLSRSRLELGLSLLSISCCLTLAVYACLSLPLSLELYHSLSLTTYMSTSVCLSLSNSLCFAHDLLLPISCCLSPAVCACLSLPISLSSSIIHCLSPHMTTHLTPATSGRNTRARGTPSCPDPAAFQRRAQLGQGRFPPTTLPPMDSRFVQSIQQHPAALVRHNSFPSTQSPAAHTSTSGSRFASFGLTTQQFDDALQAKVLDRTSASSNQSLTSLCCRRLDRTG